MLRKLMKTSWTYHLVTKYVWNVSNYNPLSKSDIKYHTMHHYGWSLLNTTPRKNTQRTKHIIQILDHRKCKNLCIVTEHVHTFFIKKTKNKRSSKIIKPKRNYNSSRKRVLWHKWISKLKTQNPSLPLSSSSSEIRLGTSRDS